MDDLDIHNYVNRALHEQVSKIVDPSLLSEGRDENNRITHGEETINGGREINCIISLLKIGLKCSAKLPNDRMHINEVVRKLHLIKDVLLGVRLLAGLNHQDEVARSGEEKVLKIVIPADSQFGVPTPKNFYHSIINLLQINPSSHPTAHGSSQYHVGISLIINISEHFSPSHWEGVTCSARHQRVIALILRHKQLSGTISPHVRNLSFMRFILLAENQFHGEIPQEFGRLFRLRALNLSSNAISGKIPAKLNYCAEMIAVDLTSNKLEGKIPIDQLSYLKKLEFLSSRKQFDRRDSLLHWELIIADYTQSCL
nr:LRR receptor-like serine/threonine-protein kinase GSO2 [Coffea arabica]